MSAGLDQGTTISDIQEERGTMDKELISVANLGALRARRDEAVEAACVAYHASARAARQLRAVPRSDRAGRRRARAESAVASASYSLALLTQAEAYSDYVAAYGYQAGSGRGDYQGESLLTQERTPDLDVLRARRDGACTAADMAHTLASRAHQRWRAVPRSQRAGRRRARAEYEVASASYTLAVVTADEAHEAYIAARDSARGTDATGSSGDAARDLDRGAIDTGEAHR